MRKNKPNKREKKMIRAMALLMCEAENVGSLFITMKEAKKAVRREFANQPFDRFGNLTEGTHSICKIMHEANESHAEEKVTKMISKGNKIASVTIRNYVIEHMGNASFSIKKSGEPISYADLHDATDLTKEEIKTFDDFVWGPVSFENMVF